MSHHNHNYRKISTDNVQSDAANDVTTTLNDNPVNDETIDLDVTETEQEAQNPVIGVVCNCKMLNVRSEASTTSSIVTIIASNTEVEIDEAESTTEFYKIRSLSETEGFNGYCMKEYITIK